MLKIMLVTVACLHGSWSDEIHHLMAAPGWTISRLTMETQQRLANLYYDKGGTWIDAAKAYAEHLRKPGMEQYTVVFLDGHGCIVFKLNVEDEDSE